MLSGTDSNGYHASEKMPSKTKGKTPVTNVGHVNEDEVTKLPSKPRSKKISVSRADINGVASFVETRSQDRART